jgi:predicted RNA binding protein YcfA (HicA-like mRNA interferase family)
MPKLKRLSGKDIVGIFQNTGFFVAGQKGSHIKLKRVLASGVSQTLTVPNHNELDKGTLKAIYNQATRYIPEEKLREYFYTK